MKLLAILLFSSFLVSCGGGGGGGTSSTVTPPPTTVTLAAMVDSLGRSVPEADFGGGDGGAAGADGSAGDGAPIANAPVVLTDNAGHTATATTDAQGYYRVNVKGFTPPFVVKVARNDGTVWFGQSTTAVKTRGFVTINLTGLTDKVGAYVAAAANVAGGAASVTPAVLAANPTALQASKTRLTTALTSPLTYVGLNPAVFDPVASPYQAVKTDTYDKLLERVTVSKDPSNGNTVVVGTFAGVRESFLNGTGAAATFSAMESIAVDSKGNVFVADSQNHVIRKVTPAGVVTTFAGSGSPLFRDGTGTDASFTYPKGVAVDSADNIYVADWYNCAIRKITPTGVVTTLAGGGTQRIIHACGFTNGTGTAARFNYPSGLAVDSGGNVLVADTQNHVIRKVSSEGVVTTLAGTGSSGFSNAMGTAASFNGPTNLAIDANDNIFVADIENRAIRKVTPAGLVSTFTSSSLKLGGVAVDRSGNVFVADTKANRIRMTSPGGAVSTLAGSSSGYGFLDGTGSAAQFRGPTGLAVDNTGNVFVADTGNQAVRKITPAALVSTLAGSGSIGRGDGTGTAARFRSPQGVAVDASGNVFVADTGNSAIRRVSVDGAVSTLAGSSFVGFLDGTGASARFRNPTSVAVDSNGNVFVADSGNNAIRKITPSGVVSTFAGGSYGFVDGAGTAASFASPVGVAVDSGGNVFVADTFNNAIRKITAAGVVSTLAGNGSNGFTNGIGAAATFDNPSGVAVDSTGNLYVADTSNHAIRKITPSGVVSTLAGTGSIGSPFPYIGDVGFFYPIAVGVDANGNVFVADTLNNVISRIKPSGAFSTIAGDGDPGYSNGTNTTARFDRPQGIAVDRNGNVFVGDTNNNAIRIVLP
jgi:sugar lactone lactonase YvrE